MSKPISSEERSLRMGCFERNEIPLLQPCRHSLYSFGEGHMVFLNHDHIWRSLSPVKTLLVIMPNARVLRDIKARNVVKASEVLRKAYLCVARNETLSPQVRHQAQLQLNTFGKYTRPTTVKNRCTESGRGRGVISEFALCRYQFRLKALNLELPGVRKASW